MDHQKSNKRSLLPQLPFSMYIVASKKSGKTTMLLNLLKTDLRGKFNKIIWSSPTSKLDEKVNTIFEIPGLTLKNKKLEKIIGKKKKPIETGPESGLKDDIQLIERIQLDDLTNLINHQKKIIQEHGKENGDHVLIVMDDSIEDRLIKSREFADFIFKSRHYKISIVFISQSYFSLPKRLRLNSSAVAIFDTGNMKELKSIHDEHHNGIRWRDFMKIFEEVTNYPYKFLVINYDNPKKDRLIDSFEFYLKLENS